MTVCLLWLGRDRFEIYSEPPEDSLVSPAATDGRFRRWSHTAWLQWQELVAAARHGRATGRFARWRDTVVRHLAETIAEQRTLWALRAENEAILLFPASLAPEHARRSLDAVLAAAKRRHGVWLVADALLLAVSAILAPIPGPNAIAYYLAFRVVGHVFSWRGAQRSMTAVVWTLTPDDGLAELATLVGQPRATRAARVADIAARLNLHQLLAYFERVAA